MGLGWLDDAAFALGTELSLAEVLREGVRTSVARCWVDGSTRATDGERTVIAKCFRSRSMAHNSGGLGIVREWAGLATVPGAPTLHAADLDLGIVVMADLGHLTSFAEVLAGDDSNAALAAGAAWGRGLGSVMTASRDRIEDFRELVRRADPNTRTAGGPTSPRLPARGATTLVAALRAGDLAQAVAEEVARLDPPAGDDEVLTQADPCPGNVLLEGSGARFLDYEATSVHHPSLDVAHLVVPWVSCDESAAVTDEFRAAAMEGYRRTGPQVEEESVALAATAATLQTTELALAALRRGDRPGRFASGRQRLVSRWRWVADSAATTPTLAELCGRAAHTAVAQWGWPDDLPALPCFSL